MMLRVNLGEKLYLELEFRGHKRDLSNNPLESLTMVSSFKDSTVSQNDQPADQAKSHEVLGRTPLNPIHILAPSLLLCHIEPQN